MTYRLEFRPSAIKDLCDLPGDVRVRVAARTDGLAEDPRRPGTEALHGLLQPWRKLRVGDYRVIYEVDDKARTVEVVAVGNRRSIYPRLERMERW